MDANVLSLSVGVIDKEHVMRYGVVTLVFCAVVAGVFGIRPAGAVKQFLEQFKAVYVKPKTSNHTMQIFNAAVEKKGCTICHLPKPKKGFNTYGAQFKGVLSAKRDAGSPATIRNAIKQVAMVKTDPAAPKSPTFGQRLSKGKLPVGEIHVEGAKDAAPAR